MNYRKNLHSLSTMFVVSFSSHVYASDMGGTVLWFLMFLVGGFIQSGLVYILAWLTCRILNDILSIKYFEYLPIAIVSLLFIGFCFTEFAFFASVAGTLFGSVITTIIYLKVNK